MFFSLLMSEKKRRLLQYLTAICSLSGGMYSGTTDNNFTWNILVNKLASIGRVPFD